MKQIYNFEQSRPPILNENMIYEKIEQRNLNIQIFVLVSAAILLQIILVGFSFMTYKTNPLLAVSCISYILLSAIGGFVITVVYNQKGGLSW